MSSQVDYRSENGITTITIDDGKRNALSPKVFAELNAAFDRAEAAKQVVVLTGREGVFSAGFDLKVLRGGGLDTLKLLRSGFELSARLLAFPLPLVIACTGHALAMGSFLLLSADYRIGVDGDYKLGANEVAIGLTMPHAAVEICRQRLNTAHFARATTLAEIYSPKTAVEAGFLDRVVSQDELMPAVNTLAAQLGKLDLRAHAETKLRIRESALEAIRAGIRTDMRQLAFTGVKRMVESRLQRAASQTA